MSKFDYNTADGRQRKVLLQELMGVFRNAANLNRFLVGNGFDPLNNYVAPGSFKNQVFELIEELHRLGELGDFVAKTKREFSQRRAMDSLEERVESGKPRPRHWMWVYPALGLIIAVSGILIARFWPDNGDGQLLAAFSVDQPQAEESVPLGNNLARVIEGRFPILEGEDAAQQPSVRVEVFKLPDREPVRQTGTSWLSTVRGVWSDQAEFSGVGLHEIIVTASVGNQSDFRRLQVTCTDKSEYFDDSFAAVIRRTGERPPVIRGPASTMSLSEAQRYYQQQERMFWQAFNGQDYDRARAVSLATLSRLYKLLPAHADNTRLQESAAYMWKNHAMALQRSGGNEDFAPALEESEKIFRLLRDQDPDNEAAWNGLGSVSVLRGDYELAEKHIERALDINPEYTHARTDLESVQAVLKEREPQRLLRTDIERVRPE